jgi:hypothetical protein
MRRRGLNAVGPELMVDQPARTASGHFPQTSHDEVVEPMTAKEVLVAVLRNEGAELAAHEMIRRAQHEAEGIERLSAKYLTLATEAQAERFDALLARSGLSDDELASVADSAARARCLRDCATPKLAVSTSTRRCRSSSQAKSLADAGDIASVLHSRVDRWANATGGRSRHTEHLIAGTHAQSPRGHGSGHGPGPGRERPGHATTGAGLG